MLASAPAEGTLPSSNSGSCAEFSSADFSCVKASVSSASSEKSSVSSWTEPSSERSESAESRSESAESTLESAESTSEMVSEVSDAEKSDTAELYSSVDEASSDTAVSERSL